MPLRPNSPAKPKKKKKRRGFLRSLWPFGNNPKPVRPGRRRKVSDAAKAGGADLAKLASGHRANPVADVLRQLKTNPQVTDAALLNELKKPDSLFRVALAKRLEKKTQDPEAVLKLLQNALEAGATTEQAIDAMNAG
jgi:hypothetical protein